ncbi:FxDxF family PEP-CTERM protein [Duganella sp.]|uniref:FxDxF family PEP-CTERM protein n=1 Tax=Duganella sp. TaxID=1904440 RepID=UPI0031D92DA6
MKIISKVVSSLIATLALSSTAYAAQPGPAACGTGTPLSTGYVDCTGAFSGNLGSSLTSTQIGQINSAFSDNGFTFDTDMSYFKSDVANNGLFTDNGKDMSLNFTAAQKGLFVIGLKQANFYSFYLVDGGTTGISTIDISSSGVFTGGNGLSHAVYLGNLTSAVPEADAYAMMLAGLGVVGFIARRRKAA